MWSFDELADQALAALAHADARCRDENAVRGLDTLPADALFAPVIEAWSAQLAPDLEAVEDHPLPTATGTKRRAKTKAHKRTQRADLVLQEPSRSPPSLPAPAASDSLFVDDESQPRAITAVTPAIEEDALWLALHACGQFVTRDDVPTPNTRYLTDLVRTPAKRIRELGRAGVDHAGLVLIHFCASEEVAQHDLGQAVHRWLDDDLPIRSPVIRVGPLDDRIGNTAIAVCAVPVRAFD